MQLDGVPAATVKPLLPEGKGPQSLVHLYEARKRARLAVQGGNRPEQAPAAWRLSPAVGTPTPADSPDMRSEVGN